MMLSGCLGGNFGVPVRDMGPGSVGKPEVVHVVRKGDTLYSIAWDAGLDYRALARWNGISPPYVINPGQRLRLRPRAGGKPTVTESAGSQGTGAAADTARRKPAPDPGPALPSGSPDWLWPTSGPVLRRYSPGSANPGIDVGGTAGQVVKSAADGRVVYSGDGLRGYGQLIIVKHNETYLSAYAHNRKLLVAEGEHVKRGQPIAEMGSTGTDRVKLHFEIRKQGNAVDPLKYLPSKS